MGSSSFIRFVARAISAMSLSNTAKTLKTPLVGAFQMLSDPLLTEHYARLGFGAVLIDQQHGLLDERTAFECVQRLEKFPSCFPIIRVCDNTTALISRALDAGACGIIAPMINTREDAQRLVEQCRYAPVGKRSWGPTRALIMDAGTEQANNYVKVFAMIETAEAIKNLDDILDLDGLDGAFVGPSDLSILPRSSSLWLPHRSCCGGCDKEGSAGLPEEKQAQPVVLWGQGESSGISRRRVEWGLPRGGHCLDVRCCQGVCRYL